MGNSEIHDIDQQLDIIIQQLNEAKNEMKENARVIARKRKIDMPLEAISIILEEAILKIDTSIDTAVTEISKDKAILKTQLTQLNDPNTATTIETRKGLIDDIKNTQDRINKQLTALEIKLPGLEENVNFEQTKLETHRLSQKISTSLSEDENRNKQIKTTSKFGAMRDRFQAVKSRIANVLGQPKSDNMEDNTRKDESTSKKRLR